MNDRQPLQATGEKLLRVSEVATRLNLSLSTVYQLIETGRLPSHNVGMRKGIRVSEAALLAYVEECRSVRQLTPASPPAKNGSPFRHLDAERLRDAWHRQGVRADRPNAGSAPSSG